MVTSLVRSTLRCGHPCSVPNDDPEYKEYEVCLCNMATSPLRSLLLSPMGDRNCEVPLYNILALVVGSLSKGTLIY